MSCDKIEFDRRVRKDLKSVAAQEAIRIKAAISDLAENPRPSRVMSSYSISVDA